jgi:hypothetical protein
MKINLSIQDIVDKNIRPLFRYMDTMQYSERIKWIMQNKLDILLMLYDIKTLHSTRAFHLWKKQMNQVLFVQNLLDSSSIKYMFAKTIFLLPYMHADIDIVIHEKMINNAILLLRKNGYNLRRILNRGEVIELKNDDVSVELHRSIEVLGLLQMSFESIGEPIEISIDIYNKLLNRNVYWKCPNLVVTYILKLLDILDHKVITLADLLELKIFSDVFGVPNILFYNEATLHRYPKVLSINEAVLLGKTLMTYEKMIYTKLNILSLIKEFMYYLKILMGMI